MHIKYRVISLSIFFLFFSNIVNATNTLPDIGTVGAGTLTIEKEQEYGWAFRLMANQSLPIIHDPVLNYYLNKLGQNLVAHADSVKLPFDFFLIEDDEINAAAFLGGNVKVHTGLFLYAKNESELASVLAHEIAHITQRHLARMLEQQSLSNPGTLAALAGSVLLSLVSPTAGMATLSTTMAITMQSQINYTRAHEYEADRLGMQTLAESGYDPSGMPDFFSKLADKYKYSSLLPEMLSTHPLPETRLAEARLRANQLKNKPISSSLDYQLSRARVTVRYSKISADAAINYYQSQLKNSTYQIKEAARYGLALSYIKKHEYLKAHQIILELIKIQPDNIFFIDLLADTSLALNKADTIIELLLAHYKRSPENEVYIINLVHALQVNKQYQQAEKILELFIRNHPKHILASQLAIELYQKMQERAKEHASKAHSLALQGRFREASMAMGTALAYAESRLDQARYSARIENYKKDDLRLQRLKK